MKTLFFEVCGGAARVCGLLLRPSDLLKNGERGGEYKNLSSIGRSFEKLRKFKRNSISTIRI